MTRFTQARICHLARIGHYRSFMGTGLLQCTRQLRFPVTRSSPRKQWEANAEQLYAKYRFQEHN